MAQISKTDTSGEVRPEERGRWRKAVANQTFEDGDRILVRVPLHEDSGGGDEFAVVEVRCDEGRFDLKCDGEHFGWEWADVDFWIPVKELYSLGDVAGTNLWLGCLASRLEKLPEAKNTSKPCSSAIGAIGRLETQRDALREAAQACVDAAHLRTHGFEEGDISDLDFSKMLPAIVALNAAIQKATVIQ